MKSLKETISSRRSVFPDQFIEKEISKEILDDLLTSANCAPSHRKTYPWRFVVLTGEAKTNFGQFLADAYKKSTPEDKYSSFKHKKVGEKPLKSGAVIAICMQRDPKERVPEWEEIAATAMAVQNIWLRLEELELGGYWSTPGLKDYFREYYELPAGQKCLGFFYLGYVKELISSQRVGLEIADYVHHIDN
jgi:nitroreductase